jgi:hypothetical protein
MKRSEILRGSTNSTSTLSSNPWSKILSLVCKRCEAGGRWPFPLSKAFGQWKTRLVRWWRGPRTFIASVHTSLNPWHNFSGSPGFHIVRPASMPPHARRVRNHGDRLPARSSDLSQRRRWQSADAHLMTHDIVKERNTECQRTRLVCPIWARDRRRS